MNNSEFLLWKMRGSKEALVGTVAISLHPGDSLSSPIAYACRLSSAPRRKEEDFYV